jgi:predicted transcriptional regulator
VTFSPTEFELALMRVLERNPWSPPAELARRAELDLRAVRSALAELRRYFLVQNDGRLGASRAGRYVLTSAGSTVLADATRQRALAAVRDSIAEERDAVAKQRAAAARRRAA